MASVARSFHVTVEQLATANQLHSDDALDDVEALVVPVPLPSSPASHTEVYKARRGDTLVTIADRFGVSLDDLHRWNHTKGASVIAGQRIRVTEPARVAPHTRDHSSSSSHHQARQTSTTHKAGARTTAEEKPASKGKKQASSAKKSTASTAHESGNSKKPQAHHKGTSKKNIEK